MALVVSDYFFFNSPLNQETPTFRNLNDSVKYVGMETCKKCHQDVYETFIETGMGKSFDYASKKKSSGDFRNHAVVYDSTNNMNYLAFWEGDSMKISEFRMDKKDTLFKRTETIKYIIGSGQHTNSHISETNGYLFQVPLTFYTQSGKWDLPPGFESGANSRFSRAIGLECISCHNAYPDFISGSENKFSDVPRGIDCERCHGPGDAHVNEKLSGRLVDVKKEIDYSIVNPAKLSPELQFDLCSRCHLQGNAVLKEGKSYSDFRPGMNLSTIMNVFMPVYKGAENEFIMASHVERLKMSNCFIETSKRINKNNLAEEKLFPYKDALTCVSCHNPHVSVKLTGKETFNKACKKCHSVTSSACTENPLKLHESKDNCVSCHMIKSNTTDIPHVITTDHYIRKPVDEKKITAIKEFIRLTCINNPAPDSITLARAYLQQFERFDKNPGLLDLAKFYLENSEKKGNHLEELVQYYYLRNDFKKITELAELHSDQIKIGSSKKNDKETAWMNYRIGEAYYSIGKIDKSLNYFSVSVDLAPFILEFRNKLGAALMNAGKVVEAKLIFEQIILENNKYAPAWSNLGYSVLVSEQDTAKAGEYYDIALSLNPDYELALLNKAGLFVFERNITAAREILKRVLVLNPENRQAKKILEHL